MNTESTWSKPTIERLDAATLTQTRGFGRHGEDRDERNDRGSRWNRGKKRGHRDDS